MADIAKRRARLVQLAAVAVRANPASLEAVLGQLYDQAFEDFEVFRIQDQVINGVPHRYYRRPLERWNPRVEPGLSKKLSTR